MKLRNLTPHTIHLVSEEDGEPIAEFPSEGVVRAQQTDVTVDEIQVGGHTVKVVTSNYGTPDGLPGPLSDVMLIVSVVTAQAAKAAGRTTDDLLITSGPVREEGSGRIIGCTRFARI